MEDLQKQLEELKAQLVQLQAKADRTDELEAALLQSEGDHKQAMSERDQLRGEARAEADRANDLAAQLLQAQPLANKAKDLERELKEATQLRKGKTVLITRERKLLKLYGRPKVDNDPEVSDWITDMRQHIEDLDASQQIDTIMGYLGGEAKDEVKLRPLVERDSAEKILAIIENTFKVTASLATLSQMIFNRVQQPDETIQSYSLALLKLNWKIEKKGGKALDSSSLIDKFVEGLLDDALKRELRRLSRDDPKMTFGEFRQKVLDLVQEDDGQKIKVKKAEVEAESDIAQMMRQQKDWQEQITKSLEELKNHQHQIDERLDALMSERQQKLAERQSRPMYGNGKRAQQQSRPHSAATAPSQWQGRSSSADSHTTPTPPPIQRKGPCFQCGRLGHIARECWWNTEKKEKNTRPVKKKTHQENMMLSM